LLRVLAVASELFPLVKTGGLADVTGALPLELLPEGVATTTLIPGYPGVLAALRDAVAVWTDADLFGGAARVLRGQAAGLEILALDAPHLFARPGGPYAAPDGGDWPDNAVRFAALGAVAAAIARGAVPGFVPDVLHAHDWQAGLALAHLRFSEGRRPGTVMTVHNLAFQGVFPASLLGTLGLPPESFTIDGVEFHGMIGFLKAGLALADRITTVSPGYAAEIQTPAFGMGFDGLLRARAGVLRGILNGIDDGVWDPAADPALAAMFDGETIERRAENKRAVQMRFSLRPDPEKLLFGVVSRLSWQKGLDMLLACLEDLLGVDAQLAVLGTGERALEDGFRAAASAHAGRIGCVIGYDESLAHLMQGGIDALLVPSRFEPCGLTQLCALRYGALPVVARTGGLADTVIDANEAALAAGAGTGIQFSNGMLGPALRRAAGLWRGKKAWRGVQKNAMRADVSWGRPARQYAELYREVG
jgi:starch synthase